MKITGVELLKVPPSWVWLEVHTDRGVTGLGEPYLENHPDVVIREVLRLEDELIGEDPRRIEHLWNRMYHRWGAGYKGGPVKMSAISGIDMALWDILGKVTGEPVSRLLGGRFRNRVQVYRACGSRPPRTVAPGEPYDASSPTPAADEDLSRRERYRRSAETLTEDWNFRCLKAHFSPGEFLEPGNEHDETADCVAAIRDAVGPDVSLAVDVHNAHPNYASSIARSIEPYDVLFLEEPVPLERPEYVSSVAAETTIPIAVGERWMGKWAFDRALEQGAMVLQPDLAHAGGLTELKKIAAMAEARQAAIAPHTPLSPLSFAATVQLAASVPNFLVLEHNEVNDTRENGRTLIGSGYLDEPFVVGEDGCVSVPEKPGLGVERDPNGMAEIVEKPWRTVRG